MKGMKGMRAGMVPSVAPTLIISSMVTISHVNPPPTPSGMMTGTQTGAVWYNTKVHVEAQDEESDRFWDYFVNG